MNARKIVLAGFAGLVMSSSLACQGMTKGGRISIEQNTASVRRQVDEAWNKGNMAVLDELMAADLVFHDPPPGIAPDREGFKKIVSMHRKAMADFHVTIEDIFAEGDKVAVRWSWSGTQKGEYMGIAPTGKQVTLNGISIHRFKNGKIVENWHKMDMLGLMQQLGVVPPPRQGGG